MARLVVVVPAESSDRRRELESALAGEDARVVVDRRRGQRRRAAGTPRVDRRGTDRRGRWAPSGRGSA